MMEGEDEKSEDSRAFNNKPLYQRALVVFAGPFFNFILAFVLAVVLMNVTGVDRPLVTSVEANSPAENAGIQRGDVILKLNNYPVNFYKDINVYTFFHHDEDIAVTYKRDGETKKARLTPKLNQETGRYIIGVSNDEGKSKVSVISSLGYGFCEMKYQIYTVIQSLRMLVTGKISINNMSGPVGIVKAIGDTYNESMNYGILYVVLNMINFAVLLSANLGAMNLLPIPALDGGRLLLFLVEAIRRKKLNDEIEGRIHIVGFALLMLLMALVMFNDIRKLIM